MARRRGRPAARVAAGIIVSRLLGFVRQAVFARFFGASPAAGAFLAALRIPNAIRNLLGEGTLSASFIPVYAGMLARGEDEDARRLSSAIVSLLIVVTVAAAGLGILLAPWITDAVAPGFSGSTRALTIALVRIMFPMSGLMIVSAWCLGVLNTHGRFFLSYAAPAFWNVVQIATLVTFGAWLFRLAGASLAHALAWGALAGAGVQLGVQLPSTLRLSGRFTWSPSLAVKGVRQVVHAWIPVVFGAGVNQVSSIIDTVLASLLGAAAVATLNYAMLLYLLPLSIFGVSVAAASLPEMSRRAAVAEPEALRREIALGARRVVYFVVPSAFGLAALGTPIVAALYQRGAFRAYDTTVVAGVLAAFALGLLGQASVKLFASGFYALGDTKTPVRIAAFSVALSAALGAYLMQFFGAAGIALGSAIGGYVSVTLHIMDLQKRIGPLVGPEERRGLLATLAGAVAAAAAGMAVLHALGARNPWLLTALAGAAFALAYGGVTLLLGHPDARRIVQRERSTP